MEQPTNRPVHRKNPDHSHAIAYRRPEPSEQHILVVDDDPAVRMALEQALTAFGYQVSLAADGSMALEIMDRQGADLAILDITIPDMDGFEICHTIKNVKDIPVIFLTAARNRTLRENLPQMVDGAGGDCYLHKPLDVEDVTEVVQRFLPTC